MKNTLKVLMTAATMAVLAGSAAAAVRETHAVGTQGRGSWLGSAAIRETHAVGPTLSNWIPNAIRENHAVGPVLGVAVIPGPAIWQTHAVGPMQNIAAAARETHAVGPNSMLTMPKFAARAGHQIAAQSEAPVSSAAPDLNEGF
jgi:hypothetical protein